MKKVRSYQYRLYPNKQQEQQLQRTFGCCRFVYNQMIKVQEQRHDNGEPFLTKFQANEYCNHVLKQEYPFLKEVDKFALSNSIFNLNYAYQRFFKMKAGYPKFKTKRRSAFTYKTNYSNHNIYVLDHAVKLPKLKAIKAVIHRRAPEDWVIKSAIVSQTSAGDYYCSIWYEYESVKPANHVDTKRIIGLDYKSDGFYVASDGTVLGSPKYYRKVEEKINRQQKKLGRMKRGSNNYNKQRKRVAKLYQKAANQRRDFAHKQSAILAEQYDIVCVENLNLRAMSNHSFKNGKANSDNGYGLFLRFLDYKMDDAGKMMVRVDRFYPSSQICSNCGMKNELLADFSIRKWKCPNCNAEHDRDINAAKNICNEGLSLLLNKIEVA